MPGSPLSARETVQRGKEIYDTQIRPQVETDENIGKIIVIDVDTGDYEIDPDHLSAAHRARNKRPHALLFATRIGFPTLSQRGGYHPVRREEA